MPQTIDFASLSMLLDGYFTGVKGAASSDDEAALDRLVSLFEENAVICVNGKEIAKGSLAIKEFYKQGVLSEPGFWPRPVEGSRVAIENDEHAIQVDIFLHSDFRTRLVRDIFRFQDDKIVRMEVETITDHHATAT